MRILITNDDSINSPVLPHLVEWARKHGEVTVAVPKHQQSGQSHAIEIHTPFVVEQTNQFEGATTYVVDSTPVDCVRLATLGLKQTYDLVISGINNGLNMGEDILYSGTCACIFEAKLRGIKGIAFSTEEGNFDHAMQQMDRIWEFFQQHKLLDIADIYNVNIPKNSKEQIVVTKMGGPYFTDMFTHVGGGVYKQQGYCIHENVHDITLDTDATIDGYVTITPLTTNRCSGTAFKKLQHLQGKK